MTSIAKPPTGVHNRYAHIDAMRALAVLIVVLAHAGLGHIIPGGSGVTIFFAISGFIITFLLLREREGTGGFSIRGFYFRRATKIFPPFLIAIVVPTLIFSLSHSMDWAAFAAQIFFIYNWIKVTGIPDLLPGTGVVWSLAIEEQFYIIFSLIWLFAVRVKYWREIVVFLAILGISWSFIARLVYLGQGDRIYYGSDTRLEGIAWGVLSAALYHLWTSRGSRPNFFSRALSNDWSLALAGSMYLFSLLYRDDWFRDTFRFTLQGVAACLIILYGLMPSVSTVRSIFCKVSNWRPVSIIGLASYSIYLVHLPIGIWLNSALVDVPGPARGVIAIATGLIVGIGLYYFVEVPALNIRKSWEKRQLRAVAKPPSHASGADAKV